MSHPRLGVSSETKGDFDFFIETNDLQANIADPDDWGYQLKFSESNLKISNDYYKELYDSGKIVLVSNLYCSNTIYYDYQVGLKDIILHNDNVDGVLEISFYLAAQEDFVFEAPDGTTNVFFDSQINIAKGEILSAVRTQRIPFEVSELNGNYHPIKFGKNRNPEVQNIQFKFDDESDHIYVYFPNEELVRTLKKLQDRYGRKYREVFKHIVSVPIHIEAIRSFVLMKENEQRHEEDYSKWHKYFRDKYDLEQYDSIDDLPFEKIYEKVTGELGVNNSLFSSLNQLNEIFERS